MVARPCFLPLFLQAAGGTVTAAKDFMSLVRSFAAPLDRVIMMPTYVVYVTRMCMPAPAPTETQNQTEEEEDEYLRRVISRQAEVNVLVRYTIGKRSS